MSTTPNTRKISIDLDGTHQSMVDINLDLPHFTATLDIVPQSADDTYQIAVISQDDLDEGKLNFDTVTGATSSEMDITTGKYQNYYLILKSSDEMKGIDITIDLVENIETLPSAVEKFEEPSQSMLPKQWKYAVLGIVLVVGCVLLFKFYKKKK